MQATPVRILGLWAVAFGFLEASVVVYLRALLDPAGTQFPRVQMPHVLAGVEMAREASTLVLLAAAAGLARRRAVPRLAAFLFAFGIWDLAYYAALRLVIHWPRGLGDWDLLFLLPVPWAGPVYAPLVVSLTMVAAGGLVLRHEERHGTFSVSRGELGAAALAGAILMASFVLPGAALGRGRLPERYPVLLFGLGECLGGVAFARAWRRNRRPLRGAVSSSPPPEPEPLARVQEAPPWASSSSGGAPTSTGSDRGAPRSRDGR